VDCISKDTPKPPAPPCTDRCCGGPTTGDPINIDNGSTVSHIIDVDTAGALGDLMFVRMYTSDGMAWNADLSFEGLPKPFGGNPAYSYTSLAWWHNYVGVITADNANGWWNVRNRHGFATRFTQCTPPCWAAPEGVNQSTPYRLQATGNGFVVWKNDEALVYNEPVSAVGYQHWFLSQVLDKHGQLRVQLVYKRPTSLTCGAPGVLPDGGAADAPYLYELRAPEASLRLSYASLYDGSKYECVIRDVSFVNPVDGGTVSPAAASYAYFTDTQERPGRIATATLASRTESYTYGTTSFTTSVAGATTSQHTYDSSTKKVTADSSASESLSITWATGSCVSGSDCCGETPSKGTVTEGQASRGDNVSGSPGFTSTYLTLGNNKQAWRARLFQRTDACTVTGSCSPGTIRDEWACSTDAGLPGYERAKKNKRDNWEAYQWAAVDAGLPSWTLEKRATMRGATNIDGGSALEVEYYAYVYGDGGQQLLSTTTSASVLSAGNNTVATNWYDSNNSLMKVTRTGYTVDSSQATTQKTIATFYSTSRTCGGTAGPDALGRILETRGPCFVTSDTDTSCASTSPVTVNEYYPDSDTTFNRNRLYKVRRYVQGSDDCSSGTPLTTTYSAYDALGDPGTITDENGNDTTYTYDGAGRVTSRTIASHTTRFAYDSDKLTRVMQPEANGEVYCYRTGGDNDCTTGSYTPLMQWKAKKACSGTTSFTCTGTWTERVNYTYAADGTVSREDYRACEPGSTCNASSDGTLRRVLTYSNDAHRRSTWRGVGDSTGKYNSVSFFDRADNLAGVGFAFNSAPVFCGGQNTGGSLPDEPISKLCATVRYDRADRLSSMTEYPTTSSSGQTTCFGHDTHGNITAVHSGCAGTSGCGTDGVCTAQGGSKASQYTFDDFGNLVFLDAPWTSDGSGGKGRWLYNFDAAGHVTYRRSPEQIAHGASWYTSFAFDQLGRATLAQASTDSGTYTLWQLSYDSITPPTNCASPTNLVGRLARRTDASGSAYFSYDAEGHVLSEQQLRNAATQCQTDNTASYLSPAISYTYSNNGNLSTLTYPQGRQVEYDHGAGADTNRVTTVKVQKRESGAWNQYTVVQNVLWEPYGGLRRYQVTPPGGSSFTVEYRQGDNSETAPMASFCTASWTPSSDDHTSRLRALWVSSGQQSLGGGSGDIYRRWYQWRGDVPARTDSCLLQETTPRTVVYGYDDLLQITMADGGYPSGPHGLLGFAYDARGNRSTASTAGASALTTTYSLTANGDLLNSLLRSDTAGFNRSYAWDKNGRPLSIAFGPNDAGVDSYTFGYTAQESTTFSTLSIGGATYSYSYDGLNRRASKQYPSGASDEFFYDEGHQLLAERGLADVVTAFPYPVDDYVWLGGRLVAVVHGLLDSSWARQDDTSSAAACARNGVSQACGFYFPVTDVLGTPVLALDSSALVTGVSETDEFGYPNRGALAATTGTQPYANNLNTVLGSFQIANGASGTITEARVKFAVLETESSNDTVGIEEVGGGSGQTISGATTGPTWTSWLGSATDGGTKTFNVRFVSNASVQAPGAVAEAFEYRRYQSSAASPWLPPLRFPGQYHDAESDLFENWNRDYDPFVGRYLQPEPMLFQPEAIALTSLRGRAVINYSYAQNDPVAFVDPSGLQPTGQSCDPSDIAGLAVIAANGDYCAACDELKKNSMAVCKKGDPPSCLCWTMATVSVCTACQPAPTSLGPWDGPPGQGTGSSSPFGSSGGGAPAVSGQANGQSSSAGDGNSAQGSSPGAGNAPGDGPGSAGNGPSSGRPGAPGGSGNGSGAPSDCN
jgi:RHS repeat-associated protein